MTDRAYFVTGTDTGAGKTFISAALLIAAASRGLETLAIKPVAAGCTEMDGARVNDDALILQRCATRELSYAEVNPVALELPIAPHIAAAQAGLELSVEQLAEHVSRLRSGGADFCLVEGAGGWLVPLNDRDTLADLCAALAMPVVLVVNLRLGCLNHALLTAADIRSRDLELAAWAGTAVEAGMAELEANIATLAARLDAPCLGIVPYLGTTAGPEDATAFMNLDCLVDRI